MLELTGERTKATFEELLEDYDYRQPRRGEYREGTIVQIDEGEVIVDLGLKSEGIVPPQDIKRLDEEMVRGLQVGDEIPVYILRTQHAGGDLLVSINKGLEKWDWDRARGLLDSGDVCEAQVVEHNRGGLLVQFGRLRGFVPNSHVSALARGLSPEQLGACKARMVGQAISLKVIEVNRRRRRLVLSQRLALLAQRKQNRERLLAELSEGDIRRGTVSGLTNYGVFVDLGGVDGLIHISELAWHHVKHPREVLNIGDEVDVYVLRVDRERGRIGLSRKQLFPDPWTHVEDTYQVEQWVEGLVTGVVDFGAFVELPDGIEGLLHVSEMADSQPTDPKEVVQPGDKVQVKILRIQPERRRMSLSLRNGAAEEVNSSAEDEDAQGHGQAIQDHGIEQAAVSELEREGHLCIVQVSPFGGDEK